MRGRPACKCVGRACMDALTACALSCAPIASPKIVDDKDDDEPDGNDLFGKASGDDPLRIEENLEDAEPPALS